ncbi:Alpha/Beta hydrolase protein [Chytridium lagenaria]|nr:Alpha/Beta hydrolase protein [Chytridium lagenaria]
MLPSTSWNFRGIVVAFTVVLCSASVMAGGFFRRNPRPPPSGPSSSTYAVPPIGAFNAEINAIVNTSYAGYMDVGDPLFPGNPVVSTNLFFWYFPGPANSTDLVLFLNGGPGCLVGMFRGVGPIKYTSMGEFYANKDSWHLQAHIVFVDQPAGTGYSYNTRNTIPTSEDPIATGLHTFLRKFISTFNMQQFSVVIAGESFAGQYVPYLLQRIVKQNAIALFSTAAGAISVKGVLLISPWMDAVNQYKSFLPVIQENGYIPSNSTAEPDCLEAADLHSRVHVNIDYVRSYVENNNRGYCFNEYDTRLTPRGICSGEVTYGDMKLLYLLNDPTFRNAVHTNVAGAPSFFYPCSQAVLLALSPDGSPPSIGILDQMLSLISTQTPIPIHVISGKYDLIVNPLGIKWALGNLTAWSSHEVLEVCKLIRFNHV